MILASGLAKYFGGKRALGPVSFEIGRGETVGFLGLNGAGKTTVLRMLAGDLRPSAGTLEVDGVDAMRDPLAVRRRVGFLPELPPLYPDMTVGDYLGFAGRLRGMSPADTQRRVAEVGERIGLLDVEHELVRNLSQGYRQRVGLAQALVHRPDLLVLDEPSHDLDPAQIVEMRSLLGSLKEEHTILVSSHNLPEISETCDRLLVLEGGEIIASGTEEELSSRWLGAQRVEVAVRLPARAPDDVGAGPASGDPSVAAAVACLRGIEGVREVALAGEDVDGTVFVVESEDDRRAEVCRRLVEGGFDVTRLERKRQKLESVFLDLVRGVERERDSSHLAA